MARGPTRQRRAASSGDNSRDVPMQVGHHAGSGRLKTRTLSSSCVSNIWQQSIAGGAPQQLTNFTTSKIFRLAWSRAGQQLVFERGTESNDATLISDFK